MSEAHDCPQQQSSSNGSESGGNNIPHVSFAQTTPGTSEEELKNNNSSSNGNHDSTDNSPRASSSSQGKSPKKRRKVNHACVYCRRSHMTCDDERPCTRCVKRNIGHLCHDEPREPKKIKSEGGEGSNEETSPANQKGSSTPPADGMSTNNQVSPEQINSTGSSALPSTSSMLPPRSLSGPTIVAPSPVSGSSQASLNANSSAFLGFSDWPAQQQDWNPYHHQWMFSNPEVSTEYNLMNEFLLNSIYDDTLFTGDNLFPDAGMNFNTAGAFPADTVFGSPNQLRIPPSQTGAPSPMMRPASVKPSLEKAKELYYLTAADPPKDGVPEERMKQVLKAKHDAGLLRPFNYINGYKRLQNYMDKNMLLASKQRVQKSIQGFRPKFRERTQKLTDIDLVFVEEWFERSLMEYDRVFASMAVPACLWRRTGEIFRGNKEFAELIHVPIEQMRDGKLAIYELIAEDSAVSYWEKFGAIAFDPAQKAMLTTCYLKNPDQTSKDKLIHCCFSFTIRRDTYNIPSMIIGNFLPIPP